MEAFNRLDVDAAVMPGSPGFEYRPPRDFVQAGFFEPCYRGRAGFGEFMSTWSDVLGLRVEPVELIDLGDRVVLLADLPMRAQASGVRLAEKIATVSLMKDGKGTHIQAYTDHAEALEAVGLRE